MGEITRGQDVSINLLDVDGNVISILNPQSFDSNLDSDEERQTRLGDRREPPRQVLHGWSGSATFEEEGPVLDDLVDTLQNRYLGAEPVYTIDIVETVFYPENGTSRTYLYPDAVFKLNRSASGKNDPNERTLEWTSDFRVVV